MTQAKKKAFKNQDLVLEIMICSSSIYEKDDFVIFNRESEQN